MSRRIRSPRTPLAAAALLACIAAAAAAAAEPAPQTREFTFDARSLHVDDMIGAVTVGPAPGDLFTVTVTIRGEDAEPGSLEFLTHQGQEAELMVKFPIDKADDYVYPPLGPGSSTSLTYDDEPREGGSWVKKVLGEIAGRRITVRGNGRGMSLWADVAVGVPRGRSLTVSLGVGEMQASQAAADLRLDTGNGDVAVADVEGKVTVDTGSGGVTVRRHRGSLVVDTGSGDVEVRGADCDRLAVDTGSGDVVVDEAGAQEVRIDTGSGDVELQLTRLADGKVVIDTGSGDIDLFLPDEVSAHLTADTGSGRIRQDLPGATVRLLDEGELDMTVGDSRARVTLDAGSGSITIGRR